MILTLRRCGLTSSLHLVVCLGWTIVRTFLRLMVGRSPFKTKTYGSIPTGKNCLRGVMVALMAEDHQDRVRFLA